MKAKAYQFIARMHEEELKKHGPCKHALGDELEALLKILPDYHPDGSWSMKPPEKAMRQALYYARVVERCEVVLWGKARTSVRAMVEKYSPLVKAFDDERAEEKRQREEREARRKAEEEARRRERETAMRL